MGCIGWLSTCTRPDLATVHSFLSSYLQCPSSQHMGAAIYALHYIHSIVDYGISFTSREKRAAHAFLHFPRKTDTEAYLDAVPPQTKEDFQHLGTYADACWGSQLGNSVPKGTPLELFKFRSMSGAIVLRMSGPTSWKAERQDRTSLSTGESEIKATNTASKLTVSTRHFADGFTRNGVPLTDTDAPTPVHNDNEACVQWCHNMTSKSTNHMEMWENSVREWIHDRSLDIKHVPGLCNIADIFTKEIKDKSLFCRLRDAFMCRLSTFIGASAAA